MENKKPIIKAKTPKSDKYDTKIDIYTSDPKKEHKSIHIAVDSDSKEAHIIDTTNGQTEHTDVKCYLTTACMKHYLNDFDDNCYELTVLRWFRDNYVSKEDIDLYYQKAPLIVEAIEAEKQKDLIYNYIYDNIVDVCVEAIERGDYNFAYNRYKSSILSLEGNIVKPYLAKMYVNAPTRTFMGKVYRDSEYQGKKKKVLEIQLP